MEDIIVVIMKMVAATKTTNLKEQPRKQQNSSVERFQKQTDKGTGLEEGTVTF